MDSDNQRYVRLVRFLLTHRVEIYQSGTDTWRIKGTSLPEGLDTTRTYSSWDLAAQSVIDRANSTQAAAA